MPNQAPQTIKAENDFLLLILVIVDGLLAVAAFGILLL